MERRGYVATDTDVEHLHGLRARMAYRPDIEVKPLDFSQERGTELFRQTPIQWFV